MAAWTAACNWMMNFEDPVTSGRIFARNAVFGEVDEKPQGKLKFLCRASLATEG